MKSFKTLARSWKTPRAIHPPKSSQIALPSRTRRHSLHSCAITPGQGPAQAYRDQYHWIEGAESLEKYTRGGYHPVMIGDVTGDIQPSGLRDTQQELYVALKVGVSDSRLHETAILKRLSDLKPRTSSDPVASSGYDAIPQLLDEFTVRGPNGTHPCHATTPAQCSLSDASRHSLFRLEVARALSVKLVSAVAYMHSQGYIHGDIHLGNAMLKSPSSLNSLSVEQLYENYGRPETVAVSRVDGAPLPHDIPEKAVLPLYLCKKAHEISLPETRLILADFGEAFAPASSTRPCQDCRSPLAARPPEARFEPPSPLSFSADIWTLAIIMWKLVAMKPLFSDEFIPPDAVVAQHVDVLGPLPHPWWRRWQQRHQFFDEDGNSTQGEYASPPLGEAFGAWVQKYRKEFNVGVFSQGEKTAFLQLLRQMLSFDPRDRPTAAEVLESDWVVEWARPDFERSIK
ncbi:protein kinase domain-containing protein, partial [Metarhizium hybridum]